jgi:hypothetical protein
MSNTITQAFVQQWDDTIRLQAQQTESRLFSRGLDRGNITGESFTVNELAPFDKTPANTTRHGDTTWTDAVHTARIALMQDFYDAKPVDRADEPKILANPVDGRYMKNLVSAWNRRLDDIFYTAARATVTLKDATTVALPSAQKIAHGGVGMTKGKLIQTRKLFRFNEADQHNGEELCMAYTADMLEDILADVTLTSADFLAVKMLQEGDVSGKWMGFEWIPFEGISAVSSSTYYTIAWAKSGMHVGRGFVEGKSQRRGDKKDTMQVSMAGSAGAVRAEDTKVVEIAYQ